MIEPTDDIHARVNIANDFYTYVNLHIFTDKNVIKEVIWEKRVPAQWNPHPFQLRMEDAQVLLQSLWDAGLRPAQERYQSDQIQAMNNHLQDMRKIAFKFLKI